MKICIIGGGAAGMAAAVSAARSNSGAEIFILEKESAGKKLFATGNGRCNMTNSDCEGVGDVLDFFYSLGVITKEEEEGRIYPYCGQASVVVRALTRELERLSVKLIYGFTVTAVNRRDDGSFEIYGARADERPICIRADKVLLAAGGKAGPQFGCTGDGYRWAKELGHTVKKVYPVLTAFECAGDFSSVKGVRAAAMATLYRKGKAVASETGEVQFTGDGLSGICIFNLSRFAVLDSAGFDAYEIGLDLARLYDREELSIRLGENPFILYSLVPDKLAELVLQQKKDVAYLLKDWRFSVTGAKGWKTAQATGGGVSLDEINSETMESKKTENLFFAGEIVDYDGPCGGFNLHNAWVTGIKAGKAMAGAYVQNS